jgi:glycosyltransferase involved in cell wall biosynthesis
LRILIANNRYFVSGGPERYLFALEERLAARGHVPVPFAMRYARNAPTQYARYFTEPPLDDRQVYFDDRPLSAAERARMLARVVTGGRVARDARRVLRAERIDLVYALQVAHFLYPGVVLAAHAEGVPVVARLSDFHLIAPCYTLFRDGAPCEECRRSPLPALAHRCLKGSRTVTAARVLAMAVHRLRGAAEKVDRFVAPTAFLRAKMIDAGFPSEKIVVLPTFTEVPENFPDGPREGFFLFVGNVLVHKGLAALLAGLARVPEARLIVAGNADTDEGRRMAAQTSLPDLAGRVEFRGMVDARGLADLYRRARAVVVPSLWYENLPHVVIEAMAAGAPVLASNIGSLPETVRDGETGLAFDPNDERAVAAALRVALAEPARLRRLAENAFRHVKAVHAPDPHLDALTDLFARLRR